MRITLDGHRIYDYLIADLEKTDRKIYIPIIDEVMTFKEFQNIEYTQPDLSPRLVEIAKRTLTKTLKEFAREALVYNIHTHFLSIPPGMERLFIKLIDDIFVPTKDKRNNVIDNAQAIAFEVLSDSMAECAYMIEVHDFDRWAMVDVDFINLTCVLTVGRNLKDHLHELKYGKGRWRGEQYFPNGETDAGDIVSDLSLEGSLLETVRGLTGSDEKTIRRPRNKSRRPARRTKRRR